MKVLVCSIAWRLLPLLLLAGPWVGLLSAAEIGDLPGVEVAGWQLKVSGNQAMTTAELLAAAEAELQAFRSQGQAASAIDDAAFQMELGYRHAGYPTALVDYSLQPEARQVVFTVQEGRRLMLNSLTFIGNQGMARERLLALEPSLRQAIDQGRPFPYVAETVDGLLASIQALYLAEGYLKIKAQATVPEASEEGGSAKVLTITLEEGLRFTVSEVVVAGDIPPELGDKLAEVTAAMQGTVYQRRQKLMVKTALRDCYGNAGYADVEIVVAEEVDEAKGVVHLLATVTAGKLTRVDGIEVSGNQRTEADFILNRLPLAPGDQYSLDDKRESFSRLYQTGLFSSVDLRLVDVDGPGSGHKTMEVQLAERKAREIYLEPGWGSYELLRLKSGYKDSNLFGSGRILRFDSAISTMGRSLEVGVSDPWFLGSDITVGLPFHYRYRTEPTFTMESSGADLYLLKTIHKKVTVNAGYQYSKNVVSDSTVDPDLLGLATNYNTASLTGQVTRDTRDDMFFPSTGYRGNLALAIARPEFGGTISYNRLLTGVRYFYPLSGGAIVGLRFNTGVILPTGGEQSIPVAERFFNGGESSVRSFQTSQLGPRDANGEPLGGTAFSTYSLEWRKKFSEDLAWSLFCDLGNVAPNRTRVDGQSPLALDADTLIAATWRDYLTDFRSGLGAGLQYMLPVGPARLDLAVNPDRDAARDEPDYVLHFSIGMAF